MRNDEDVTGTTALGFDLIGPGLATAIVAMMDEFERVDKERAPFKDERLSEALRVAVDALFRVLNTAAHYSDQAAAKRAIDLRHQSRSR